MSSTIESLAGEKNFYRALEDAFRGSREQITKRLSFYLPFVNQVKTNDAQPNAVDLGCGRGEWLELLQEHGFNAAGVDLDEGMLNDCYSRGLNAKASDALAYLTELETDSIDLISAFHVVEHLPFEYLIKLTQECCRVLKPTGLLIFETPNPENIVVGTSNFYTDPTHERPIPPQLLNFVCKYSGFNSALTARLQEDSLLHSGKLATLIDVFAGVSPDYAIIASKAHNSELKSNLKDLFSQQFGLSLNELASRFESRCAGKDDLEICFKRLEDLDSRLQKLDAKHSELLNSRSWKITQPLRQIAQIMRWFKNGSVAWLTFSTTSRPRRLLRGLKRRIATRSNRAVNAESHCKTWRVSAETSTNTKLLFDMYVLSQGVKTGVYRVCDELFPRLINSTKFDCSYIVRPNTEVPTLKYIEDKKLPTSVCEVHLHAFENGIVFNPFGVSPKDAKANPRLKHAHIVYDLIGIYKPEYFTPEAASEVKSIIDALDNKTTIFAISESTKKELLAYRKDLAPEQVTIIPLAAGKHFSPCVEEEKIGLVKSKYKIPANQPYVLSVATLEVRKNLEQVVASFVRFIENNPQSSMHLVLAGMSGWKLEKLESTLAAANHLRNRIILTGFVADEDLSALYSGALCFVYLSRYEGFGLPILEAMACGTPVISANNSSLPEVVGSAGLLFDADDVSGVAKAIESFAVSPELREKYSKLGLTRAGLFDWDKCAEVVIERLNREALTTC